MTGNLRRMEVFSTVVEAGSLSAAAKRLGLSRAAVSRHLGLLEDALEVRLLGRTTRSLRLTEAGELFYQGCRKTLDAADAAEQSVRELTLKPAGVLRITAPVISHALLLPIIAEYLRDHPSVQVDLVLEDLYVNLVEQGYDLGVRIGHPRDSSLHARRLMPVRQVVVASPAYLDAHGWPLEPQDLQAHAWIIYSLLASPRRFVFSRGPTRRTVRVAGRLQVNGGPAAREALLLGLGLTLMPEFYVAEDIRHGRLHALLADYLVKPSHLVAVYPSKQHLSSKIRTFVDLLSARLKASSPL